MSDHIVIDEWDFSHPFTTPGHQTIYLADGTNVTIAEANFLDATGQMAKRLTISASGGGGGATGSSTFSFYMS